MTASRSSAARARCPCSRWPTPASATCAAWRCRSPAAARSVSRPFDKTRDGFVLGEGAGSLFLEDMELAKARGAKIYAEVVGYGSAADGWDMIQPIAGGAGSARAMKMALDRRGVPADEVDLINPHGTDAARRQARGGGDLDGLRRPGVAEQQVAGDQRDQVDDRPHDGRGRRVRSLRDRDVGRRAVHPADDQLQRAATPSATSGSSPTPRPRRCATRCRATSASAATTARWSSSTTTATEVLAPRIGALGARALATRALRRPRPPVPTHAAWTGFPSAMPVGASGDRASIRAQMACRQIRV